MNHKHIEPTAAMEQQNGQYAVARNRKADIIAIVICLLVAVLVWLVVMNGTASDYVELVINDPDANCEYELSVTQIEIEGRVIDLRNIEEIEVDLTRGEPVSSEGDQVKYKLTEEALKLPEGVALSKSLNLIVTKTPK